MKPMATLEGQRGFRTLLCAILLLLFLQPMIGGRHLNPVVTSLVGACVLASALWRLNSGSSAFWVALGLMVSAIVGGYVVSEAGVGGSPFHAPFYVFIAWNVLTRVLNAEEVSEDTVLGSACAYLLLGLAFASAYNAIVFFVPGAIAGLDLESHVSTFSQLAYFSLVTLTTLGYGDLSPVHPLCQSLVVVESVVGVLFPALVVARIIGLYVSPDGGPLTEPEPDHNREWLISRVLFVFLPLVVLLLPWLERGTPGRMVVGLALAATVIVGVYFVSGNPRTLVAGFALAIGSSAMRMLGGGFVPASIILAFILVALVVGRMSVWCLVQRRVTTSVLLTSVCLYWLIGIGFAGLYQLVENLEPGAIGAAGGDAMGPMLYFSFMTLTTTGYGDLLPGAPLSRALANVEAFVGVFYTSIVIAKLVSLYGSQISVERPAN